MSLIVRRNSNMSTDYLRIIPETPDFVPDEGRQKRVVSYLRSIAADAEDVTASVSEHIEFVDCGCNFESIACPSCGVRVELKHWHAWMDEDFDEKGFVLTQHILLCCGTRHTLHELRYESPQGFARFKVSAMNPMIGRLTAEQHSHFELVLDSPARVIYQHI